MKTGTELWGGCCLRVTGMGEDSGKKTGIWGQGKNVEPLRLMLFKGQEKQDALEGAVPSGIGTLWSDP